MRTTYYRNLALFVLLSLLIGWGLTVSWPRVSLGDFGSFVASGQAANAGLDPYAVHPLTLRGSQGEPYPNLNPPVLLPALQLLAHVDPQSAFRLWYAVSLALYILALALLARAYPLTPWRLLWALALAGLWFGLWLGQVYTLLALGAVAVWVLLPRRPLWAGLLLGLLVAVKPNLAPWVGLLLLAGHWRPALAATGTAAALWLGALLAYGPAVYAQWLAATSTVTAFLVSDGAPWLVNLPLVGYPLAAALLLGAAVSCWRYRPEPLAVSAIALPLVLVALPNSGIGYCLLLLPVLLSRPWSPLLTVAAALLLVPFWRLDSLSVWAHQIAAGLLLAALAHQPLIDPTARTCWLGKTRPQ